VDLDLHRKVAAAVFERGVADLDVGHVMTSSLRHERPAKRDTFLWAYRAGSEFRWWCHATARDWRDLRRSLLRRSVPEWRFLLTASENEVARPEVHGRWLQHQREFLSRGASRFSDRSSGSGAGKRCSSQADKRCGSDGADCH
jgi:hypothetical protein